MRRRPLTAILLTCGVVGPPLFVIVFVVDGATRPGYDPAYHPVSALSLDDRGWIQITNFVLTGLLLLAFTAGLRRALYPGRAATWGPVLVGGYALGLLLSGAFVMDPMRGYPPGTPPGRGTGSSWHHVLHDYAGLVVFVCLPLACFVLARRFASGPASQRGWTAYSVASGIAGLSLFVAFGIATENDSEFAGLVQRATIVVGWAWVTLLALRLRAEQRDALRDERHDERHDARHDERLAAPPTAS